jgi:hypothetical protein
MAGDRLLKGGNADLVHQHAADEVEDRQQREAGAGLSSTLSSTSERVIEPMRSVCAS